MVIRLVFHGTILISMPIISFILGHILRELLFKVRSENKIILNDKRKIDLFILAFGIVCLYKTANLFIWMFMLDIPMLILGFCTNISFKLQRSEKKLESNRIIWGIDILLLSFVMLLCLKPVYKLNWSDSAVLESNRIIFLYLLVLAWLMSYLLITFFDMNAKVDRAILYSMVFLLFLIMVMKLLWKYSYSNSVRISVLDLFSDQVILFNIGILFIISLLFYTLLGKGWGTILNILFYLFLFVSNFLKIRYHATIFTWFDLLQIKELLLIGREFLKPSVVFTIIIFIAILIGLIIKFGGKLKQFLHPQIMIISSLTLLILLGSIYNRISTGQYGYLDIYKRTWENEVVNVRFNGLIVNLIFNFNALQEIIMDEPEDYGLDTANDLLAQFQDMEPYNDGTEINPDVILILGESLFDLDGVEGLSFDVDIDETIDAYSTSAMLSPRYGGYTSAMEFEALTGLTLAFMPPSLTPFTTYFNNPADEFPCIVREFKESGYVTKAIHPDLPDFYNRTIVYRNMGFDEYQAINSFTKTEENTTLNGWILDDELGNHIINELEKTEQPQFIYAATMEEHYVNTEKYEEPLVHAASDQLNESDLNTLSQQATSYYHTDQMIKKLVDYMDNTDRPTLLYVFGDHLPPLEALSQLGYIDDLENKYRTTLVMYSNYKNISMGVPDITPNQIATQILMDAVIDYHSYFDYIYSLREKYPVIHQEFTDVINNEDMDIYKFIQYDILFGERYLYN